MVNYKQQLEKTSINIGGMKYTPTSVETPVIIFGSTVTTTGTTMHTSAEVDYVVPTGKTLKLLGLLMKWGGSTRKLHIIQNDDINAKATEVKKFTSQEYTYSGLTEIALTNFPTVAADKYVNIYYNSVTTPHIVIYLIGVEF